MDSNAFGKDSWDNFPPMPLDQKYQGDAWGDTGVLSKPTGWERLITEIIEDVVDCTSIDLIGFDTFQEGE